MKRRDFITLSTAALLLPAITPTIASAAATLDYEEGVVADRLKAGETVFVDFYASWCGTCKAQDRVIEKLRAANPAYDKAMTFVRVDWDFYADSKLAKDLNIPRRSTLVVLKGDKELGRVVAGTSKSQIQALMDAGLKAVGS